MHLGVSALIFPAVYPLADSITEVYGKKVSYYLIVVSYCIVIIFSFLNNLLLSMADNQHMYDNLMQSSIKLTIIGPIGYLLTSYINIRFISKLKIYMRGKHFIIRSFICSGFSDLLLSLIVLPVIFYPKDILFLFNLYVGTVLTKIVVTIPFIMMARILVFVFRNVDDIKIKPYNSDFVVNNNFKHGM